ncbi:hypothetical protein ONZ51_g720 [Trametes cubensis]|uniref:Uncharacterized protein n=1 Tax=Trametes cubensis TaxID=1111947 RepID=A0AAD7U492_9APHY|nr:hypothetical protein ONZ51_g720 [Trametes cubensis]
MNAAALPTGERYPAAATTKDEDAVFARATERLFNIGAVPVSHFLQEPAIVVAPQNVLPVVSQSAPSSRPATGPEGINTGAVARLHQACQQAFGSTEALNYEFEVDDVSNAKRCKLTITLPNGNSRIYTSPIAYQRKYDAKAHVSAVAIENGAIDFIVSAGVKRTLEGDTAPQSNQEGEAAPIPLVPDESVDSIDRACLEWTNGRIKPFWLIINEPKFGRKQGCALRIRLGPRNSRVWSVSTVYDTPSEARKACAEAALADGILDYIRTWSPSGTDTNLGEPGSELPNTGISLDQFFEALPRPFPEPVTGQTAADVNGPAWLNTTIQSARGGKIVPNFIWTVDPKYGFHGCLLRLERPGEVKSYLVDARFSKRAEAKAAVCLLAMVEGAGDYIRSVAKAIEDKLPASMRKYVSEVLIPVLNSEYRKAHGPGIQPHVEYDMDLDACGATLTVELCPSATPDQVRKYTVPTEYRNRNDAKLAVIAHAVEQGAIEFLRFKGRPTPPGYVPYYAQQKESYLGNRKRKTWDSGGGAWGDADSGSSWQSHKKPRTAAGGFNQYHGGQGQGQGGHQNGPGSWGRNGAPGPSQSQYGDVPGPSRGTGHFQHRNVRGHPPSAPASLAPYPAGGGGGHMQPPASYPHYPAGGAQPFYPNPPHQAPFAGVPAQVPQYGVPNAAVGAYPTYYPQPQPPPVMNVAAPVPFYNAAYPSMTPGYQAQPYAPVAVAYPAAAPQPGYYPAPSAVAPVPPQMPAASPPGHFPGVPGLPPSGPPVMAAASAPYMQYQHALPHPPSMQPTPSPTQPPQPPAQTPPAHSPPQPAPPQAAPTQPPPPQIAPPQPAPPQPAPPTTAPPPPPPPSSTIASYPTTNGALSRHPPPHAMPTPSASPSASDRAAQNGKGKKTAKVTIAVESTPKTNVTALYGAWLLLRVDHCRMAGMPTPQFCHEIVKDEHGAEPKHNVWVIIGKTKFGLPVTFSSLSQGQEKVAKKVLDQLRQNKADGKTASKSS